MKKSLFILALCALSCSGPGGGGSILTAERLDENVFPLEPGGETFAFWAGDCLCTASPCLVWPEGALSTVTLNGFPLDVPAGGRLPLDGMVQEGENVLFLQVASAQPAFLAGDFDVLPSAPEKGGWQVVSAKVKGLGSLTRQGLPFYTGEVSYRLCCEHSGKAARRILRIPRWKGARCQLFVNCEKVADVTGQRFRLDIGPYLVPGQNEVEVRIAAFPASHPGSRDFGLYKISL